MTVLHLSGDCSQPTLQVSQASIARNVGEALAWLDLNVKPLVDQVLDPAVGLGERLRLQGVACERLDEFFAMRVAERRGDSSGPSKHGAVALPPESIAGATYAHGLKRALHQNWRQHLQVQLSEKSRIVVPSVAQLTAAQQSTLTQHVARRVWPLLTPLVVDQGHPFPVLRDGKLNLAVVLCQGSGGEAVGQRRAFAIVAVPSAFGRLIELPSVDLELRTFVLLEEAIAANLGLVFTGFHVAACCAFRVIRARQPLQSPLGREVRRGRGKLMRLEMADAPADVEALLRSRLGLQSSDVCRLERPIHLGELSVLGAHVAQRAS